MLYGGSVWTFSTRLHSALLLLPFFSFYLCLCVGGVFLFSFLDVCVRVWKPNHILPKKLFVSLSLYCAKLQS